MTEVFLKDDIIENHMIFVELRTNPKNLPLHSHEYLEIFYICEGSAIHHYNGKQIPVKAGDFFFIDYNSKHKMTYDCNNFVCITCTFVPEFIDSALLGCAGIIDVFKNYTINLLPHSLNGFYAFHDDSEKIQSILYLMLEEYLKKEPGHLSFLRTYLIQLILLTIRKVDILTANIDERIVEIIDYVNVHYNEQITLEMLCQKYYCSLSNISILFKAQVGITFTEYLRKTRMDVSCRLLANSRKNITTIANDVGYTDIKTFRKHFKAHVGMTPCSFRKKYQGIKSTS